jgi:hypothetical protein
MPGFEPVRGPARFSDVFPAAFVLMLQKDWRQNRRNSGACAPALYSLSYDQNLAAVWRPGIEPGDLLVISDVVPSAFAKFLRYQTGCATRVARHRDTVSGARILGPRFPRSRCSPACIRTKSFIACSWEPAPPATNPSDATWFVKSDVVASAFASGSGITARCRRLPASSARHPSARPRKRRQS